MKLLFAMALWGFGIFMTVYTGLGVFFLICNALSMIFLFTIDFWSFKLIYQIFGVFVDVNTRESLKWLKDEHILYTEKITGDGVYILSRSKAIIYKLMWK